MSKRRSLSLSILSLSVLVFGACSFGQNTQQNNSSTSPKNFELPNLIVGSNQTIVKSDNNSSVEIRDGKLVNKASDANPSSSQSGVNNSISQPNTPSSVTPSTSSSDSPNSTPTSSPSSSSSTTGGQLNIQINPNPPAPRNTP